MLKNALLGLSLCGLLVAGPCLAHAHLQSSTPADNAQLTEAPKTLSLNFSEAAQLAVLKLRGRRQGDSGSPRQGRQAQVSRTH
jgi:methionine-rich copper-binding protein CopC